MALTIGVGIGLGTNIGAMATGSTQDATVTSVAIQGGARVLGVGPTGHTSLDLVSNKEGQIQLFMTQSEGYYINGQLLGDEELLEITDTDGYMSQYNGVLPQEDSFMTHQFDFGVSKGFANGGDIDTFVNRYGGNAMVFTGEVGLFEAFSADGAYSWSMEGGNPGDVQVITTGASIGAPVWPFPAGGAYFPVESQPLLAPITEQPFELPDSLIPICQVVGQCGN
ncbi:MAG: hypothetical protein GY797_01675 [Deltaproteobacteria bacterium]|nr:hypothetical protein [Deltaproteobacteria bacterium]